MELKNCKYPWFEMQIEYNERARTCCYFKEEGYKIPPEGFDIKELWNNELFVRMRQIVLSNKAEQTGCSNCEFLKIYNANKYDIIKDDVNRAQRDNWEKALENFNAGKTVLDSSPVSYYFNFGLHCNINCIMCSQQDMRTKDKRQLNTEMLLRHMDDISKANDISIIGGEPFAMKSSIDFLKMVTNNEKLNNVKLQIFTNGVLLDRFLDSFRTSKRLGITVSLDSIGETYEYIRNGAKWDKTSANILAFQKLGKELGHNWTVNVAGVIMKSSLKSLPDFVGWCRNNDIPVHFSTIHHATKEVAETENIFFTPSLLDEVPGWEKYMEKSEQILRDTGLEGAADQLKQMAGDLQQRYTNQKNQ